MDFRSKTGAHRNAPKARVSVSRMRLGPSSRTMSMPLLPTLFTMAGSWSSRRASEIGSLCLPTTPTAKPLTIRQISTATTRHSTKWTCAPNVRYRISTSATSSCLPRLRKVPGKTACCRDLSCRPSSAITADTLLTFSPAPTSMATTISLTIVRQAHRAIAA